MKKTLLASLIMLLPLLSGAQEMASLMFRRNVVSPELSEGSITFRLVAPKARKVEVSPSWLGYTATLPMSQDRDGIWSVTVAQPEPELYTYTFLVDGVSMLDPANIFVQRDGSRYMNAVLIPGGYADNYAECSKPGNIEQVWYHSPENGMTRRMYVYTPYGYDRTNTRKKYPVLYLLHGGGGDEDAWATLGRTRQILDNLISQGKAEPMLVVMPNGNPNQYAAQTLGIPVKQDVKQYASNFDNYSSLVADILPYIEKNYPVIKDRSGRAVAGLSMGGGQSFFIALRNVDVFANVGIFSSGLIGSTAIGGTPFDAEALFPGMYSAPAKYNRFDVIYLSCGEQDNRIDGMLDFRQNLEQKGYKGVVWRQYPGGHEWKVWRRNLSDFVQLIFHK